MIRTWSKSVRLDDPEVQTDGDNYDMIVLTILNLFTLW
jgi:hypothetical protein